MKNEKYIFNTFKQIIDKGYKYFIFDCDGVIWYENGIIHDAINTIKELIRDNNRVFFLSNNNRISREKIYKKITLTGINNLDISAVYPASYLTAKYIRQNYNKVKSVYMIGSIELQSELEKSGLEIFGGAADNEKRISIDEIRNLEINPNIDAAVCGSDEYISYYKISYATNVAYRTKLLFGTNYDNNWKTGNLVIPGAYTYISSIETASEVKAQITAKPNKEAFKTIFKDNNIDYEDPQIKKKVLMIGDSLRTDIKFANNCGLDSCLVLTGHSTLQDYTEMMENNSVTIPTYIVQNLKI